MGVSILFAIAFTMTSAGAQTPPSLDRVEDLARAGRAEEARAMLMRWWESAQPTASRRDLQRGLWLRGRLTVDPVQAELDYRRLAIEYPGDRYSDEALLRLAQSAHARGALSAAALALRRLRAENPSGSVRRATEAWLARVGPLPEAVLATDEVETSLEPAETRPQPTAVETRPPPPVRPIADTLAVTAPRSVPTATTPAPSAPATFAVQLGAFSDPAGARRVLAGLVSSGVEGRLVRLDGSPLMRVRTGRFRTREAAAAEARRLSGRGFAVMVVSDVDKERLVGR